jgi:hypothetical protein
LQALRQNHHQTRNAKKRSHEGTNIREGLQDSVNALLREVGGSAKRMGFSHGVGRDIPLPPPGKAPPSPSSAEELESSESAQEYKLEDKQHAMRKQVKHT